MSICLLSTVCKYALFQGGKFAVIVDKPPGQQRKQGEEVSHEEFVARAKRTRSQPITILKACAVPMSLLYAEAAQAPIRSRGGGFVASCLLTLLFLNPYIRDPGFLFYAPIHSL